MSSEETEVQHTQHAFLVAWGWFGEHIGPIRQFQAVPLKQKRYHHTPQGKFLEFLVAILAGLKHLQDISLSAHPLDRDPAVAQAWGQEGWADYSGVSRTLSGLSWQEVQEIAQVLEQVSQPYLSAELQLLRSQGNRIHKQPGCAQARRQALGTSGRSRLSTGDPEFRRSVVKVQRAQRFCRQGAPTTRQQLSATGQTEILVYEAVFDQIASDCTTVTLGGICWRLYV